MAASMVYRIVSLILLCLLIINHFTSGLLSDYKICGDAECESKICRVQAVRDHNSKDCRFLSFRRGDIIWVYQKLTGKREDLWAGSIDKKFGYFPKDAIKEEEIYATTEKVLETQKSDFFCMDEDGYPIDTSELDNNEINYLSINEPDVTSTTPQIPSEEWRKKTVETITKSGQDKVASKEEEQGRSASSSWLDSSMTGLLRIVKNDDSTVTPIEDKTEAKGESSLASSVTGWLGFGGKNQDESSKEAKEEEIEASGTITSTMTGWLGFGSDSKAQEEGKSEEENQPGEVFRSRKIALDLEGNQFDPEENKETGTLGWFGSGISSTLGFGFTNEDARPRQKAKSEETQGNAKPVSSSWFDVGITDVLGLRRDEAATDETKNDQTQKDSIAEQNIDSQPILPPHEDPKQLELSGEKIVEIEANNCVNTSLDTEIKQSTDENNSDKTSSLSDMVIESNDQESKQEPEELRPTQNSFQEYQSIEMIDKTETEEDTAIIYNTEVIHDQDVGPQQIKENAAKKNSDLDSQKDDWIENGSKLEATETELERNQAESGFESVGDLENSKISETEGLHLSSGQEMESKTKDDNQEQIDEIQEVVFEKQNMSEEVTEITQEVMDKKEIEIKTVEVKDDGDEKIQNDELGQKQEGAHNLQKYSGEIIDYIENMNNAGWQTHAEEVTEENKQDLVEEAQEEKKEKLKEKEWHIDEVEAVMMDDIEQIQEVVEVVEENREDKLDMLYDNILNGVKDTEDERNESNDTELKENIQIFEETEEIESKMQHEEMVEYAKDSRTKEELATEVLEEIVLADNQDSTDKIEDNLWEKSHKKDKEKYVFEDINPSSILASDISVAIELNDQIAEKYDKNIIMEVNNESPSRDDVTTDAKLMDNDSSTDDYKTEEEVATSLNDNVLNETVTSASYEPTASPVDGYKKQSEHEEVFELFQNAFSFFSNSVNSDIRDYGPSLETSIGETTQPQDNIKTEEKITFLSDSRHVQDLSTVPPSTLPLSETGTTVMPVNQKTLNKFYHNILNYMNANEAAILIHHFGDHKLQFLEYILGSPDTAATGEDETESILLDIESLLQYHLETMMAPSTRVDNVLQEDKDITMTLIALQKLQIVMEKIKESFNMDKSDLNKENNQEQDISKSNHEEINNGGKNTHDMKGDLQTDHPSHEKGITNQILDINKIFEDSQTQIHSALELLTWLTVQVVSSLPDDIRPGPDLYGVPWEPIIITSLVGLVTILVFVCRCYSSVKSRMYRSKERWMAEQVAQLLDEKCKVLETLSKFQQEYDEIEDSLRDSGVLAQTQKTIQLEASAKQLEHTKKEFEKDLEQLKDQLNQQREHRLEQEQRIMTLEESIKTCEEETKMFQSQEEQAQTTLKVYSMNSDRLQRNLETAGEENALLQENNTHLRQQLEGWAERVSELEEEMRRCEISHSGMLQDVATKDERIMSLTDRLLQMKAWDSDEEEQGAQEGERDTSNGTAESGETNGKGDITDLQGHLQKVQKLIYAAKLNADLKSVDEDKDRVFAKLNDEVKAKEDLQESIKDLESEKLSMQSDTKHYGDQVQLLQQKLQIMTEMYQENELKLHRLLTVEEKERLQKEEKLTKADKNIAMAMEELNNYRQRAGEMEEELEKTKQSYQTQISSHEKKAHNNWLASRSAERELAEIRRENALLRQKLTDTQFKLEAIEKDPYALDSLARPLPFRAERSPYGPSPLGRPASETRPFLSPPTLMDGPPNRLSPRVMPPGGPGDIGSGGPHSDSGSISPTWERDRRGPQPGPMPGPLSGPPLGPMPGPPGSIPPPGYIFPEPGGPMYRRSHPGPMGLPPPGSLPPRGGVLSGRPPGTSLEMPDASFRENSFGPGEHELREPGPGDRRTPPEGDLRMGGVPPPGPVMGPIDGPFPRRAPYGPPPPDFYLPRGPGGPPVPVWGPPPPGMMYPPRFPPGGPPPPHMPPYSGPPMRPPVSDGHPPSVGPSQPPILAPTQRQSSEDHTPSPQDII